MDMNETSDTGQWWAASFYCTSVADYTPAAAEHCFTIILHYGMHQGMGLYKGAFNFLRIYLVCFWLPSTTTRLLFCGAKHLPQPAKLN